MCKPMIINGGVAVDDRGSVSYVNDLNGFEIKRIYEVRNHTAGFIRAWHGHKKEAKLVKVIQGAAIVKCISMKNFYELKVWPAIKGEERFLDSIFSVVLSEAKSSLLYIPPGYFNGFMTLTENTVIQFLSSSTLEESQNDDFRESRIGASSIWKVVQR